MCIEKVSKYVSSAMGTRSTEGITVRQMLLSIPKVKWLDGADTEYYHKYKPINEVDLKISKTNNHAANFDQIRGQPLTEKEKMAVDLMKTGMKQKHAADVMGMHRSTFRDMLLRIRAKQSADTAPDI